MNINFRGVEYIKHYIYEIISIDSIVYIEDVVNILILEVKKMDYEVKKNNEYLLDNAILMYLSIIEDACALREVEVVSSSHELIHRNDYNTEVDYFTALTDYIISNL